MSVKTVFDDYATSYDVPRRKLIPCFDDFYAAAVRRIPFSSDDSPRVLDLGAGTGLLTEMVATRYPGASFTLADISGNMLDIARVRLKPYGERFSFLVTDYANTPITEPYDLIISALSIHHLEGELKWKLFSECYRALHSGGIFINADQAMGETPEIDREYRESWIARIRANGVSEEELQAAFERMKEDRMSTLSFQLSGLSAAGFIDVECSFSSWSFVVYSGMKD